MGDLQAALKEVERVAKKQRTSTDTTIKCVDELLETLRATKAQILQETTSSLDAQLALRNIVKGLSVHTKVASAQKELHSCVSKLGKLVDKAFIPDICKAYRDDLFFNQQTLNNVIAQHLFRQGRFQVGESFCREADVPNHPQLMAPFISMHRILKGIKAHDLAPALKWIEDHKHELTNSAKPNHFTFQLHRLQYLHLLQSSGSKPALAYAKQHFSLFSKSHMPEIQQLMGCLLFAGRLQSSPYADLLSDAMWDAVAQDFIQQCCGLLGQASDSPLLVAISAGAAALPQLLKLSSLLKEKGQDLAVCEQLPVELELGQEFVFHSIFACPVSREQSSLENPPTMLPCGHVLCKQSVIKIAKGTSRSFKCPYCPMEAQQSSCRQITFPDIIS